MIKSVATKTLISTLGAAGLFVAGTQVANADTIKIADGDTVSAYAAKYNVSIDDIVKANKLADANLIIAGKEINIPGVTTSDAASSATTDTTATSDVASSATTATSDVASSATTADTTTTSSAAASSATTTTATTNTTVTSSASNNTSTVAGGAGLSTALSMVGVPYVYGGNTPSGFDCSGLVQYAYGLSSAYRTTTEQATLGTHHYDVTNAPAGALVFWGSESNPYHVGISLGNGSYVAAPQEGQNVKVGSMQYYMPSFYINM